MNCHQKSPQIMSTNSLSIVLSLLLMSTLLVTLSKGDRIKQKIYKPIESNYFCFRRLNASHQIGCQSKESGNVGAVYVITDDNDIEYVLKTGPNYPYIPVISAKHFNLDVLNRFKGSTKRITGVVVLDIKTDELSGLSPDKSCPNDGFGLYVNDPTYGHCKQGQWNVPDVRKEVNNNGLMFNDWPFPVFYIKNETNIAEINDCFNRFGGPDYPLCGIQLEAPMNAAKDSVSCIRRTALQKSSLSMSQTFFCDPLGGQNIFSPLLWTSKNDSIADKSVVVLAIRLDSFSMFDNISPGADSSLTSLVTLLAIAKTLNDYRNDIQMSSQKRNVLYALFDGEAFDYIGSSRALYDMNAGKFPVDPNSEANVAQLRAQHFSHFIELNQLATHGTDDTLYIHKNLKPNAAISEVQDLLTRYAAEITGFNMSKVEDNRPLPPASLQTFQKHSKDLGGVVIANHLKEYTNKYYNSIYDDILNVNKLDIKLAQKLTNLATVVSKTMYQLVTGNPSPKDLSVNQTLVESLMDCYLNNSVCELFKYVSEPERAHQRNEKVDPLPTYVGVFGSSTLTSLSRAYTHLLLSYFGGQQLTDKDMDKDKCTQLNKDDKQFSYYWISGPTGNGTCIKSQAMRTDALSPAFLEDGVVKDADLYSTWTESRWMGSKVRIFVMPSPLQQWFTLITGLVLTVLSFIGIYFIDKNSIQLFKTSNDNVPQESLAVGL